jgi:hypothetical protein
MRQEMKDKMNSRTSKPAVGPTLVTISLETLISIEIFVTLAILGLSRPNILFIFDEGLTADTSGETGSTNHAGSNERIGQGQ